MAFCSLSESCSGIPEVIHGIPQSLRVGLIIDRKSLNFTAFGCKVAHAASSKLKVPGVALAVGVEWAEEQSQQCE